MVEAVLQYIGLDKIGERLANGWRIVPGLAGTHHGDHAEYMAPSQSPPTFRLRRAHRDGPVELVIGKGDHTCEIYELTNDQLRGLAIDAVAFALD